MHFEALQNEILEFVLSTRIKRFSHYPTFYPAECASTTQWQCNIVALEYLSSEKFARPVGSSPSRSYPLDLALSGLTQKGPLRQTPSH